MKHFKSWSFCQILECQAPLHKRKAPLLKTFWRQFCHQYLSKCDNPRWIRNRAKYHHKTEKSVKCV